MCGGLGVKSCEASITTNIKPNTTTTDRTPLFIGYQPPKCKSSASWREVQVHSGDARDTIDGTAIHSLPPMNAAVMAMHIKRNRAYPKVLLLHLLSIVKGRGSRRGGKGREPQPIMRGTMPARRASGCSFAATHSPRSRVPEDINPPPGEA